MSEQNPFLRDAGVDKPGILGARWWNQSLQSSSSLVGRRSAMQTALLVGGGLLLLGGVTAWAVGKASEDDEREDVRRSLDVQRDYGWNFGATSETVAFDTMYTATYARDALKTLEEDLSPSVEAHKPFYFPALFQSPEALPRLTLPDGETSRVKPLAEVLKPIKYGAMDDLEASGRALGALLAPLKRRVLLIVDLAGPDTVAFAAGAAAHYDPIFAFDNWPHPKGVVQAHRTLGAAVYYQPTFRKLREERAAGAPPMIVLDRGRQTTYTDEETQFDNRYLAKVPVDLGPLKVEHVLYVVPTQFDLPELDDLNDAFVQIVSVRAIAANAFAPDPRGISRIFGTTMEQHEAFFGTYPFDGSTGPAVPVAFNEKAAAYKPTHREVVRTGPRNTPIGSTALFVAVGTGVVLGSRFGAGRNGSYNRTTNNWGGG